MQFRPDFAFSLFSGIYPEIWGNYDVKRGLIAARPFTEIYCKNIFIAAIATVDTRVLGQEYFMELHLEMGQ